jgi:hypothetical protein
LILASSLIIKIKDFFKSMTTIPHHQTIFQRLIFDQEDCCA